MRLLLVEDSPELASLIRMGMQGQGFAVDETTFLAQAKLLLANASYDIVLLDLGLPDGDGVDLIRWMRGSGITTPVIVITARDALGDRIRGLDSGADDYVLKPFALEELAARCRALLRRPGGCLGIVLEAGNVSLDTTLRQVYVNRVPAEFSTRETALLELLLRHVNQLVTRAAIDASLYALKSDVTSNAVDAAVSRLRRRLSAAQANVEIHTAHGLGYLLIAPAESKGTAGA